MSSLDARAVNVVPVVRGVPAPAGSSWCSRDPVRNDHARPSPAPTMTWARSAGSARSPTAFSGRSSPSMISTAFAGDDEEVLLIGLPVVHRHRLARPEDP